MVSNDPQLRFSGKLTEGPSVSDHATDMGLTLVDDSGTEFNENMHWGDKDDIQPARR